MATIVGMEIIMRVAWIVVTVPRTIICIIVVRTYARVVIIPACGPMMSMRTVDVAPLISNRKGVNSHVIIGIK